MLLQKGFIAQITTVAKHRPDLCASYITKSQGVMPNTVDQHSHAKPSLLHSQYQRWFYTYKHLLVSGSVQGVRKLGLCVATLVTESLCQDVRLEWCILTAGKYTIVGVVIDGMDVLDKMEKIKVGKCQS